jgi:CheY-like chemotaxis protein
MRTRPTDHRTIVLVDDDDDLRETLAMALVDEGYEVHGFARARAAIAYLEGGARADLILLDLMMAEMSGWEFCLHRARSPAMAAVPVVALTARTDHGTLEGVREVVHKPFDLDALLATIARNAA